MYVKPKSTVVNQYMRMLGVNEPQAEAICAALDNNGGFTLIEGPPGTGKTRTIMGLIGALREKRSNIIAQPSNSRNEAPTNKVKNSILICAPSNAAIDEIGRRLIAGVLSIQGEIFKPTLVRIGNSNSGDIQPITIESLLEQRLKTEMSTRKATSDVTDAKDAFDEIGSQIQQLYDKRKTLRDTEDASSKIVDLELDKEIGLITEQIYVLKKHKDTEVKGKNNAYAQLERARKQLRKKIIIDADIVYVNF